MLQLFLGDNIFPSRVLVLLVWFIEWQLCVGVAVIAIVLFWIWGECFQEICFGCLNAGLFPDCFQPVVNSTLWVTYGRRQSLKLSYYVYATATLRFHSENSDLISLFLTDVWKIFTCSGKIPTESKLSMTSSLLCLFHYNRDTLWMIVCRKCSKQAVYFSLSAMTVHSSFYFKLFYTLFGIWIRKIGLHPTKDPVL